jgi:hypothetical protein
MGTTSTPRRLALLSGGLITISIGTVVLVRVLTPERGSGNLTTLRIGSIALDDAHRIEVSTNVDLHVAVAPHTPSSVEITIDGNLTGKRLVDIEDGVLHIGFDSMPAQPSPTLPPTNAIVMPALNEIVNRSDSQIAVDKINANAFDLDNDGDGAITLSGASELLVINSYGAASVDASKLVAKAVVFGDTDSGTIDVTVLEHTSGDLYGDADVTAHGGTPTLDVRHHGEWGVEFADDGSATKRKGLPVDHSNASDRFTHSLELEQFAGSVTP